MNQVLSPGILDWDLNSSFAESFQMDYISSCLVNLNLLVSKDFENFGVSIDPDVWMFMFNLFKLGLEDSNSDSKLISESIVIFFNLNSMNCQLNWISNSCSLKTHQKSFHNSFNFFIRDSILGVDSFKLSEELDELSFVLLILGHVLVALWSAQSSFFGKDISFNFKASGFGEGHSFKNGSF